MSQSGHLTRLEPDDAKVSRPVLRGGGGGNTASLPGDSLSRLRVEADPLDHTWRYGYNALGWRTVMTDADGIVTLYDFDDLGRLREVRYDGTAIIHSYAYDALGQRIAMTDTTGVTRYGIDDLGRVTGLTHTVGQQVDYTLGYRYNARSLRTELVYPDNSVISYTYDAATRLTTVFEDTTTYAAYQYDPAGRLTQAAFPNDVVAAYAYDTANHLTGITYHKNSAGSEPELRARYAYTYDEVGNRTRAVETVLYAENEGQAALPGAEWLAANQPTTPADPRRTFSGTGWSGLLFAPLPQEPPSPIVRERGSYRAAFDTDGLRFYPRHPLFGDAEHEVAYRLTVVRRGNDVILHPGHEEPVLVGEDLVQYWRGDTFTEEYALTTSGVEQRFLFLAPITGTGNLVIEGNLTGDLQPVLEPNTGEITFRLPDTDEVVASYGRAIVQDATGERQLAQLELNGVHLRIVVPGDWLAQAQYPIVVDPLIGPNFAVSTQEILSDQDQAAAAYDGGPAALVVWAADNGGNDWDISGQLVTAAGVLLSPTIPIYANTGSQQYPAVAGNRQAGGYLVVWQSWSFWTGWDLYGQVVAPSGALVGSTVSLCKDTQDQTYPALAYDSTNDRYLLVWRGADGIYSRLLGADGKPLGEGPAVLSTDGSVWAAPDVTFNAVTAQYLAVWAGRDEDWNLAGRLVAADGEPQGEEEIALTSAEGSEEKPAVVEGGAGRYLLVYQAPNEGKSNIYRLALDTDGLPLESPVAVAGGTLEQSSPTVVYGAVLQECLVTWDEESAATGGRDVHGRRMEVGPSGSLPRSDEFVITSGAADQRYPALLYNDAATEYLAVWEDARLGNEWNIYARRVAVDGSLPGNDFLVSATPASSDQSRAAVAYGSAAGQYLVVWQDGRGVEGDDIYAQFVGGGGALVGAAFTVTSAIGYDEEAPAVAYDATHDEYLVVWQEYDVELGKHAIAGQRVAGGGALLGTRLEIGSGSGTRTVPAVAFNPAAGSAGEWLVVWEDTRNGNYDLYSQRVATTGLVGNAIALWPDNPYPQRYPDVAAAGAGGYLVAAEHQTLGDSDVYGVYVSLAGEPSTAFAIAAGDAWQSAPAVAYSAAEAHYLVVWQEQGTSLYDIWGRFIPLPTGTLPDAFSIRTSGALEESPDVACGAAVGEWYVAWQTKASALAPYDVEGGVLDAAGELLGETESLATAAQNQIGVALAYDPARSRYLAVWADSRNGTTAPDIYAQLARGYGLVVDYTYDGLYRLTEAAYSDGAYYGYAYDTVGNRTRYTNTTAPVTLTTYTYSRHEVSRIIV